MKTLLLIPFILLVGCSPYPPMSEAEAKAFTACMDKGWKPKFSVGTSGRSLTCVRK